MNTRPKGGLQKVSRRRSLRIESLENRCVLNSDWQNPLEPLDAGADGYISPLDALLVIDELNLAGARELQARTDALKPYLDVSGDMFLSPLDALLVIDRLNLGGIGPVPRLLLESGANIQAEEIRPIAPGFGTGTRQLLVDVKSLWAPTNLNLATHDVLAVYIVDKDDPSQTLIDRGIDGSAVFSLSGSGVEVVPGISGWNGQTLRIDVSSLGNRTDAVLKIQLLNGDGTTRSMVRVGELQFESDPEGVVGDFQAIPSTAAAPGPSIDTSTFAIGTNLHLNVSNIQYDSVTGSYQAHLRLENQGEAIGRQVAVAFEGLPAGVTVLNASGTTSSQLPYVNFAPAIVGAGLVKLSQSLELQLRISNPGNAPMILKPTILIGAPNTEPILPVIPELNVAVGNRVEIQLASTDADGDAITYTVASQQSDEANAFLEGVSLAENKLVVAPLPNQVGNYDFELFASDGMLTDSQMVRVNIQADPIRTTRVSGQVLDVDGTALTGVRVEIGAIQALTQADGTFLIDLGNGTPPTDTIKVRAELLTGPAAYPFIAEKLPLLLERAVYQGVNNVITRPIYLPKLDISNSKPIDPTRTTVVTTAAIPNASVTVAAGTLINQQGTPFTGRLSITEVPTTLTPAALPNGLVPDLVVTIQPGEMVFATPAPLTLPNRSGYGPGMIFDLWSINPSSGAFEIVGSGKVSADGQRIETITGGIRNSSWHFFCPNAGDFEFDDRNQDRTCNTGECTIPTSSEVSLHSGHLKETHDLVTYQSLGAERGISLFYDTERLANDRRFFLRYPSLGGNGIEGQTIITRGGEVVIKFIAKLNVTNVGGVSMTSSESSTVLAQFSGNGSTNFDAFGKPYGATLIANMSELPTGMYVAEITSGLVTELNGKVANTSLSTRRMEFLHVNLRRSAYGAGWGIVGLKTLAVMSDGSVAMIDGGVPQSVYKLQSSGQFTSPPGDFSTFQKQSDGTYRHTQLDQSFSIFSSNGLLLSKIDRNGNSTLYEYDNSKRLIRLVDPVGLATQFNYKDGKLSMIVDPQGRTTTFTHFQGNLIRITDPDTTNRNFTYDHLQRMIKEVDKRGLIETIKYSDQNGRVSQTIRRDKSVLNVVPAQTRSLLGQPTALFTNGNGSTTRYVLDRSGQLVSTSDVIGIQTTLKRNSQNRVTQATDGRGNLTSFEYDARGNLISTNENQRFSVKEHFSTGYVDGDLPGQNGGKGWNGPWRDGTGGNGTDRLLSVDLRNPGIASEPGGLSVSQFNGSFGSTNTGRRIVLPTEGSLFLGVLMNLKGNTSSMDGSMLYLLDNVLVGDAYTSGSTFSLGARNTGQPFSFSSQTIVDTNIPFDFNNTYYLVVRIDFDTEGPNVITQGQNDRIRLYINPIPGFEPDVADAVIVGKDVGNNGNIGFWAQAQAFFDELRIGTRYGDMFDAEATGPDQLLLPSQVLTEETGTRTADLVDVTGDANLDLLLQQHLRLGDSQGLLGESQTLLPTSDTVVMWDAATGSLPSAGLVPMTLDTANFGAANPMIANGSLTLDTMAQPIDARLGYQITHPSLLFPSQTVIQFRMKFVDHATTVNSRAGAMVHFVTKNNIGGLLNIGPDEIFLNSPGDVRGPSAAVDTNDHFHDYRIEVDGVEPDSAIRVYQDGELKLSSTLFKEVNLFGAQPSLRFGELTLLARGKSEWTRFEHNLLANPSFVRIGDVDGNALPDIISASYLSNALGVHVAKESGGYESPVYVPVPNIPTWAAIADLNHDLRPDIVSFSRDSRKLAIILGSGGGGFGPFQERVLPTIPGNYGDRFELADLNGDRNLDLVLFEGTSAIGIFFGDGTGRFPTSSSLAVTGWPNDFAIADMNGDQKLDLVISRTASNLISVWLNAGNATFPTKFDVASSAPSQVAVADLNGDGKGDLLSVHPVLHRVEARLGMEIGTFGPALSFTAGLNPAQLLTGDIDRDGDVDVIVGDSSATRWVVLKNQTRRPSSISLTDGELTRAFTYEQTFNQLTSVTDEIGHRTLFDIDPTNGNTRNVIRIVGRLDDSINGESDDVMVRLTYTASGQIDTVTDPLGRVTDYDYDSLGRMSAVTYAMGTLDQATQRYEYDAAGNVSAQVDENGNRTEFQYDVMNRLTRITEADPDGTGPLTSPVTTMAYDSNGNVVTTTDPQSRVTRAEYDAMDRVARIIDERNQVTSFVYDNEGNLIRTVDPLGQMKINSYDSRDRLRFTIDPEGGLTKFGYDKSNNLTRVTDPVGNVTTFEYDFRNRTVSETDPLGKQLRYVYDGANNLIRKIDRLGRITDFSRDELNRLTMELWRDVDNRLTNEITYQYDKSSNLTAIDDFFSTLTMTYDTRDRVTSVDNVGTPAAPRVVLDYDYDLTGNVVSVTDTINGKSGARTSYAYDALNRTSRITQTAAGAGASVQDKRVDFAYNALGQYQKISRFADLNATKPVVETNYTYDIVNRLTDLRHKAATGDVAFYTYTYDADSRITSITDIDGLTSYTYDDRDQLTGANHTDPTNPDESYVYDANGNRISSHLHGTGYVTGTGNRLLSDGAYNYTYDDEGNMLRRTEIANGAYREFKWDHRNRLVAVVDKTSANVETQRVEFTYDAFSRRIAKEVITAVDHVVTHFVYDREDVLLDFVDPDGPGPQAALLDQRYLHGPGIDQVLAQEDSAGNSRWHLTDHLGTVRSLVDSVGRVVNQITYDSYGNVLAQTNLAEASRYLYTGREFDAELQIHYYRARYNDSSVGRFVSEDPSSFGGNDSNLYRYVENSTNANSDPSGLESLRQRFFGWHYDRDILNEAPAHEGGLTSEWRLLPAADSVFHQQGGGDAVLNRKYVTSDGSEAVYDKNGCLVTDELNRGTYNFVDPDGFLGRVGHGLYDVLPYFIFGNSPNDSTSVFERLNVAADSRLPEYMSSENLSDEMIDIYGLAPIWLQDLF